MGPPPRVPLVLLLLLAAERTARGTFPEEPGPIAVAPPDCECPAGAVPGRGARLGRERDGFGMNTGRDHPGWGVGFGSLWGAPMGGVLGCFGVKAGGGTPGGDFGLEEEGGASLGKAGCGGHLGCVWVPCDPPVTPL